MRYLKAILAGAFLAALFAAPAQAATPGADCAAYTYVGTRLTLCADFPGSQDRDCPDVVYRVNVGAYDPWKLDGNGAKKGDGIGCEANPLYPATPPVTVSPTPTPAPTTPAPTGEPTAEPTAEPTESPSTTASPSASVTPTTEATAEPSETPEAGPSLPVTGPGGAVVVGLGVGLLALGVAVVLGIRRGRTHFRA